MIELNELNNLQNVFSAVDYSVVIAMLLTSMGIGLYHSWKRRGMTSDELEYLMAGRKMTVIPVSLSILASSLSSLGLLIFSTEMYLYGSGFFFYIFPQFAAVWFFNKFMLPIFHGLKITSLYHYLEKRFDRRVRIFGSASFILLAVLYMPILLYMPCLSFKQFTGIDVKITGTVLVVVVITYTCIGGFRATVWTDVFQSIAMFGAIFIVLVKGYVDLVKEVGAKAIFQLNYNTDRYIFPTLNPDPTLRQSIWSIFIGGMCITSCCNQLVVQRCLALPTLEKARRATWIYIVLFCMIFVIGVFGGSLLVTVFRHCDPKIAGIVDEYDQLFPLLVLLLSHTLPSLMGIYMGGMFCASLSSISTFLNSLAAVVLEDFCKPFVRLSNRAKGLIMRCVVVAFGLSTIPLITIAEKTDTIGQFAVRIESITGSSILGIFVLGIFCPSINGTCALIGGISCIFLVGWICFSASKAIADGSLAFDIKPIEYRGCSEIFNITMNLDNLELNQNLTHLTKETEGSDVMFLFRISFLYYLPLGILTTIFIAFIARIFLGGNEEVDSKLIWQYSRSQKHIKVNQRDVLEDEECGKLMRHEGNVMIN
ncbi:sodium-coupled monocarboxylate transporter 1-like [Lutzomyia longipalpis]|uniref:sodium-coupled monocarboxylate transporter 1-like n=1 Tax=Lutzomyia longipalpis TaxID=7200 RepID=UPI0024843B8F|nr:sodium-coupled monocarboxylate transporter 1-like [Lutzomyia longipalpis]